MNGVEEKDMQIAVCEDEEGMRSLLGEKIKNFCPDAELWFYSSGEELLSSERSVDILFLDIQMPGISGMEAAVKFREKNREAVLIFVTAFQEYVFQAFDVGAFHYLVKPFEDGKLKEVLLKAAEQCREGKGVCQVNQEERCLLIKTGGVHTRVFLKDIIYAEVFNRKVMIHSTVGNVEYYGRISELEKQLGEDFFRPHRAYLVHFKYVVRYNASMVELEKGSALVAKQKYSEFVKKYMQYVQRKGCRL